jgi:hypothetical protein
MPSITAVARAIRFLKWHRTVLPGFVESSAEAPGEGDAKGF